jgi:hypothetical protein
MDEWRQTRMTVWRWAGCRRDFSCGVRFGVQLEVGDLWNTVLPAAPCLTKTFKVQVPVTGTYFLGCYSSTQARLLGRIFVTAPAKIRLTCQHPKDSLASLRRCFANDFGPGPGRQGTDSHAQKACGHGADNSDSDRRIRTVDGDLLLAERTDSCRPSQI